MSDPRDCTMAIGLTFDEHKRMMALVDEVAATHGWTEPVFEANDSRTEVKVRPHVGASIEVWIQRRRVVARPGIAPMWKAWRAKRRDGWTWAS